MRPFLIEYYERRRDVRRYLAVLVRSEQILDLKGSRGRHERELRMVRAGAMLVLYNAIEASLRSGIQAIYDEIKETRTPFDDLRATLRKRVLRDFKVNFGIDQHDSIKTIAYQLVAASFDPQKLFSGNVDAREIKEKSAEFGFDVATDYRRTKHGEDLVIIKNRRNDLAHGVASFSDVGRAYTANDIRGIGRYSLAYMEAVLLQIDGYLDKGHYRQDRVA